MSIGDFSSVQVYTVNMFAPLSFLGGIYDSVVQAFVDMQNLSELLAQEPDIRDKPVCDRHHTYMHIIYPATHAYTYTGLCVFHSPLTLFLPICRSFPPSFSYSAFLLSYYQW